MRGWKRVAGMCGGDGAKGAVFVRLVCIQFVLALLLLTGQETDAQVLQLHNRLPSDRTAEVIEIPLSQVLLHAHIPERSAQFLVAEDAASKQRVPAQLYSAAGGSSPDTLLLYVQLAAKGTKEFVFRVDPHAPAQNALVFGREAPERKDDFAWENELVTYRIYGPALQATGEIASGIDVWSKRVPNFVIDSFYTRDLEGQRTHNPALSYHRDNGQGLDSYLVGPTRGCGGTAVLVDGRLYASKNYTSLHVLADGPIRFAFEVTYAPWDANGVVVTEKKQITLDAGTHLNRIESTYTFQGAPTLQMVAGLAMHDGAMVEFPVAGSVAAVWDTPQLPSAGRIATGIVADPREHAVTREEDGHALMVFTRRSGEPFVYYAGSGWSKADMPTMKDWTAYLKLQLLQMEYPVLQTWK